MDGVDSARVSLHVNAQRKSYEWRCEGNNNTSIDKFALRTEVATPGPVASPASATLTQSERAHSQARLGETHGSHRQSGIASSVDDRCRHTHVQGHFHDERRLSYSRFLVDRCVFCVLHDELAVPGHLGI